MFLRVRRGVLGRVAYRQQADWTYIFGQTESLRRLIGIETSDPYRAYSQIPRFHHHVSANDTNVHFSGAVTGLRGAVGAP